MAARFEHIKGPSILVENGKLTFLNYELAT